MMPARSYVAINQTTAQIAVINPSTNALKSTIAGIQFQVNGIAVTPDGQKVYASTFAIKAEAP
jgi:DNA-binding beta-propeller fold protein YncE